VSDDASSNGLHHLVVPARAPGRREAFIADDLDRAGVYAKTDIRAGRTAFLKRGADYQRRGIQQYFCTGSKIADSSAFLLRSTARA